MVKGLALLGWASLVGTCALLGCDDRNIVALGAGGEGAGDAGGAGGEGGEADASARAGGTPALGLAGAASGAGAPGVFIAPGSVFELDPQVVTWNPQGHHAGLHDGPWFLQSRELSGGELSGAISDKVQANTRALQLRAASDGYRLEGELVLSTYHYDLTPAPGLCAENWLLEPEDTTGDGEADRLTITGTIASQGSVSADWDTSCRDLLIDYPEQIRWTAERIEAPPWQASATTDPVAQRFYPARLLVSGTAEVEVEGVWSAAKPLLEEGMIYGFESALTPSPGSRVTWRSSGVGFDQQPVETPALTVDVDAWGALVDGSFESYAAGAEVGGGIVTSELDPETDEAIVPVAGSRSLMLRPGQEARLRLARPAGTTRLSFLITGDDHYHALFARFGVVGQPAGAAGSETLECDELVDLECVVASASLELPEEGAEVLLGVLNEEVYGADSHTIWLDQIVFE